MTGNVNTQHLAPAPGVTLDMIVELVCDRMDRSRADVIGGDDRSAQTLRARHIVVWLARRLLRSPHAEVARQLGGREPGMALNADARIEALRRCDAEAARELAALDLELRAAGATAARLGRPLRALIDPVAVARRVHGHPRAAAQVSLAEIAALADHVLKHAPEPVHV